MGLFSLWRKWGARQQRHRVRPHVRLCLECLEDRTVPSLMVTTASDAVAHTGMSLRDAITQANTDAAAGVSDTITFDPILSGATVMLEQGQLDLTGAGAGTITIDGTSLPSPISVSGNNLSRVFHIDSGVSAVFKRFVIQAGNTDSGGGVYNGGTLSVIHASLTNNMSFTNGNFNSSGGAIYNAGTMSLTGTTISANAASGAIVGGYGGGIYNTGTMTLTYSTLAANSAFLGNGGAIYNFFGTLTVNATSIFGNTTTGSGGGAGIFNDNGLLTVTNSTIAFNSATDPLASGGGIVNGTGLSRATVWNSTFTGNSAHLGGGIAGTVTVSNSTISGNTAFNGGGIAGNPALQNTIVAGNSASALGNPAPDVSGAVAPGSAHNLIGKGNGMSGISNGVAGNKVGTIAKPLNPLLGMLGYYGGTTQTMVLLPGSPAINAGGAVTTLAGAVSDTATTITVAAAVAIASTPGEYLIKIDGEQLLVTSVAGNDLTVTRGVNGTTAATHNDSAPIYFVFDQRDGIRAGTPDIGAYEFNAVLLNHAPVLDASGSPALPATKEDRASVRVSVAALLGNSVSDIDRNALNGMAVVGVGSGGTWQYSLDTGVTFRNFGAPSESAARLLRASDLIRFVPARDFNGSSTITFRAWDRAVGFAGGINDITATGTGGLTAFSADQETASIVVQPVNDAPVLGVGSPLLTPIAVNAINPSGDTVSSFAGGFISDVDAGAVKGIAIIGVTGTANGTWQYSTDAGSTWINFGAVSATKARLLDAAHMVRFVPNPGYTLITSASVLPAIVYRAWDQTSGIAGMTANIIAAGGTTAFSVRAQATRVRVNDAPVLTPVAPTRGPSLASKSFTTTIATLLGATVQDTGAGTVQGIAVTGLTTTSTGRWQYSLDGGLTFRNFATVSEASAFLLRATDRIRYLPVGSTGTATISYRAWDRTTNGAGRNVDLTQPGATGGRSAFSVDADTASLSVT